MNDKPLILFTDSYPRLYGAQRSMFGLYRCFHEQERYRLHFLYHVEGPLSQAIRSAGIASTHLPLGGVLASFGQVLFHPPAWRWPGLAAHLLKYAVRLRRLIGNLGADLLHCNADRACLTALFGAKWANCPIVTHIRRDGSFGRLDRVIFSQSAHVIWVSQAVGDLFTAMWDLPPDIGTTIYNGRELPDANVGSTRDELLQEFDLPDDAFVVTKLASLAERKDHECLVRAAEIVCREDPRSYFLVAGGDPHPDGSRQAKLSAMIDQAGLSQRVLLLGHRDDTGRLLRGADILVNSAKLEALGGSLIEAMGYGLPCVATDVGGTREIVPDGCCGLIVPKEDPEALAAGILTLLRQPESRRIFSTNARAHFAEKFSVVRCAERTAACFDRIIAAHRRRARVRLERC